MVSNEVSGRSGPVPPKGPGVAEDPSRANAIVAVLAVSGVIVALMQTLMVPLLPVMPRLLGTSAADASWTITATLLTGAVANPVYGRLGDLFGKRRMLLVSGYFLAGGSLICALSSSLVPVIAGRALQGLGLAIIPLGISIMRDLLPAKRLIPAMALMSSSLGIGGALGLPIAAIVAQNFDWHVLFWGSLAATVLIIALVAVVVPESPVRGEGSFDVPGAVTLSAGLAALLLAVSKGSAWGWSSATTLGLFGGAVIVLLAWGWWETRIPAPLVDLRTSSKRPVLLTNIASMVLGFAMYAMSLIAPQLLQLPKATGHGLGQSLIETGLWMAPGGLVMMAASPFAGRLIAARGPKVSLVTGAGIMTVGYVIAQGLMSAPWGLLIVSAVISLGVGFAYAAMPALIMSSVPASEGAAANGLNTLMRSIGTSTASAVIGVVLANMTVAFGSSAVPSLTGMRVGFVIGAGAALAACLLALAIPGRRSQAAGAVRAVEASGPAGITAAVATTENAVPSQRRVGVSATTEPSRAAASS
ncbi:MFS transporter permease [Frankia sp. R43]|uniref:MFS transporter n=1 Tax=Frankia sp. R43 TaxID=269536 RepID=UPI0006CA5D89|nr:MFS transporter [Frankia sp. R43]KPM51101.1 MFS transporter permease [Frankia sp. R43]